MKIATTKPTIIKVGEHNSYELRPAAARSHYGENRMHSGGVPYAYATKKADQAWFVVSRRSGEILGVLEDGDDGTWTFAKVRTHGPAPQWLKSQMQGASSFIVYNVSPSHRSAPSAVEALAYGLGI